VSATGSKLIQNRVFHRLLESEEQAGDASNRKHTELGPENYTFTLAGTEGTNYVLNVEPKRGEPLPVTGQDLDRCTRLCRKPRIEAQPAAIHPSGRLVPDPPYLPESRQWVLSAKENKTVTSVRLGGGGDSDYRIPVLSGDCRQARCLGKKAAAIRPGGFRLADGGANPEVASFLSSRK